ncbi:MAG TPA: cyclic pyranopterin monophosphate synthase MoaC [Acidimicrobiales bacterium]|nr:cyclic pyranopterin monophosphate synthase MoaC [Acidimicrobiales bacterium]
MSDRGLTHVDPLGRARMVDVTPKEATHRRAIARCKVFMATATTMKIASNAMSKGDVLGAARIAGIQAAKRTADMIPLCHPLLVGAVAINFNIGDDYLEVEAQVETVDRTGVEMEAMTACAIAALTIYDMCKSVDRSMVIGELALWEKTGGRSGVWRRPPGGLAAPLVNTPPVELGASSPEPPARVGGDSETAGLDARIDGLLNEARTDPDGLL